MSEFKKHFVAGVLALAVLTLVASMYVFFERRRDPLAGRKPNLLILSFCSLRPQNLRAYNPAALSMPALDKFFAESLVFKNAINGSPWTNVTNYLEPLPLRGLGYSNAKRKSLRIPLVAIHKSIPVNDVNEELSFTEPTVRNYELGYGDGFKVLKKAITTTKVRPFYYSVHVKYMHFPLIDAVNQPELWRKEFSAEAANTLEEYLKDPGRYPEKAALLLTLFADPALVKDSPFVKKYTGGGESVKIGQIYQILSDEALLEEWKKSPGFAKDVRILQEAYSLKLRNLDQQLAEVLDLYGRDDLKESTTILLTGDHGELLMENGVFLHSNNIYDDQIRYPMAIRAAGRAKPAVIEDQFSMAMQTNLLQIVAETNADPMAVGEYVKSAAGDPVYMRNCQGTVDGLRVANKYKLVSDISGYHLYNVAADPFHLDDLSLVDPQTFFRMKEMLLEIKNFPQNLLACETSKMPGHRGVQ